MKKLIKNTALSLALVFTAVTAQAQEPLIKGYFRIQNVGNEKYVEVTGPFTAKPNLDHNEAETSAGTVMYVEAVQDGDSYRLTHLRCQGIDVVETDEIKSDEYDELFGDMFKDGLDSNIAYALVREGFKYGYTYIARATVGTVFWFVATKLENHVNPDGNGDYKFYKGDYVEVAKDFNREVTAKLDLGIRLKPESYDNKTVQVYFDVPSLQPVCDWYLDEDAMLFEGSPKPVSRHEVFASAMRSMSHYLKEKDINLETFTAEDIKLFSSWGYDIETAKDVNIVDGEVKTDFDHIFSDPILLFNWIKMVGYYILNPGPNDHNLSSLGYTGLAEKAKNHYLTGLLVDYFPRLHHNTRAFLINGRVGDADSFGGSWDDSKDGTLGFAGEFEVGNAGDNAVWKLCPIDNETEKFLVKHKVTNSHKSQTGETFSASAFYFDFPVSTDEQFTTFYNLTPELYATNIDGYVYIYNKVEQLNGEIARLTPFLIKTIAEGEYNPQLNVADGKYTYLPLAPVEPEKDPVPDNSFVVSDEDETLEMYSVVKPLYLSSPEESSMRGVLLPTSLTNDDLSNLWNGDVNDIYTFNDVNDHVGFNAYNTGELAANEAVYLVSTPQPITYEQPEEAKKSLENSFVYIGDPVSEDLSGVEGISVETAVEDNVLYDLRGIRVVNPIPGNIYILNGRKYIVR